VLSASHSAGLRTGDQRHFGEWHGKIHGNCYSDPDLPTPISQKDVGAVDHLAQGALVGLLHVHRLVGIHQLGAPLVHQALDVGHPHVLAPHSQLDQQPGAGQCRGAGARDHQLHIRDALADHLQAVEYRRAHHDGGAVLVIMEDGNLHALAQLALHIEALGGLDVLEVDATESRLERRDDLDQLVRVLLVDLDVEHVDARELLEQHALAFHHWLAGQRADVAQAQHGGAVGHHAHQVTACGVAEGRGRVLDDFLAGYGHAGRIGQCQIVLVHQLLGGLDGNLARHRMFVVLQRGVAQLGTFVGAVIDGRAKGLGAGHGCVWDGKSELQSVHHLYV